MRKVDLTPPLLVLHVVTVLVEDDHISAAEAAAEVEEVGREAQILHRRTHHMLFTLSLLCS